MVVIVVVLLSVWPRWPQGHVWDCCWYWTWADRQTAVRLTSPLVTVGSVVSSYVCVCVCVCVCVFYWTKGRKRPRDPILDAERENPLHRAVSDIADRLTGCQRATHPAAARDGFRVKMWGSSLLCF